MKSFVFILSIIASAHGYGVDNADCSLYFNEITGGSCNSDTTIQLETSTSGLSACLARCNSDVPNDKYLIACSSANNGGPCILTYGDSRKDCTDVFTFTGRSYTNCAAPPPTPAPTLSPTDSPTMSPTFECYSSSTCGNNEYCAAGNQECTSTTCSSHSDCNGLFLSDRLPYCNPTTGYCADEFSGTCIGSIQCNDMVKRAFAARNSIGVLKQAIEVQNITTKREIANRLYSDLKNSSTIGENVYATMKASEVGFFDSVLFTQYNNDTELLSHIKTILCSTVVDLCDISIGENGNRRALQSSAEIKVTISYVMDSEAFQNLPASSFDDPSFISTLETALGVSPGDVIITTTEGTLDIEYVVTDEATGYDPLTEEQLAQLNDVTTDLSTVQSILITELGLEASDIGTATVDKCGDRDCNDRGTCDPVTGVCACSDQSYWGINCETLVNCTSGTNVGLDGQAYCMCTYPTYGQRCQNTKTECLESPCQT